MAKVLVLHVALYVTGNWNVRGENPSWAAMMVSFFLAFKLHDSRKGDREGGLSGPRGRMYNENSTDTTNCT